MKKISQLFLIAFLLFIHNTTKADTIKTDSLIISENTENIASSQSNSSNQAFTVNKITIKSSHIGEKETIARFGDTIIVTVSNVSTIEKRRTLENPICLYINRLPFATVNGHLAGAGNNEIKFLITRDHLDDENWDKVLRTGFLTKTFYLGVGLQDGSLTTQISYPIQFKLRNTYETIPFVILCILAGCYTIYLVWKKNLLKEKIGEYYIYSLSSVHVFFWTQIILLSYILIWFVCDDINSIDNSSLVLLGISVGTAGVSSIINGSTDRLNKAIIRPSAGFFNDILSDNTEISMHRYQMLIFNVVIGAFFIYKTIGELKMPALNETVLALLGISSITYTTLKAISTKSNAVKEPATEEKTTNDIQENQ